MSMFFPLLKCLLGIKLSWDLNKYYLWSSHFYEPSAQASVIALSQVPLLLILVPFSLFSTK